jgi:hypothetical protein
MFFLPLKSQKRHELEKILDFKLILCIEAGFFVLLKVMNWFNKIIRVISKCFGLKIFFFFLEVKKQPPQFWIYRFYWIDGVSILLCLFGIREDSSDICRSQQLLNAIVFECNCWSDSEVTPTIWLITSILHYCSFALLSNMYMQEQLSVS